MHMPDLESTSNRTRRCNKEKHHRHVCVRVHVFDICAYIYTRRQTERQEQTRQADKKADKQPANICVYMCLVYTLPCIQSGHAVYPGAEQRQLTYLPKSNRANTTSCVQI